MDRLMSPGMSARGVDASLLGGTMTTKTILGLIAALTVSVGAATGADAPLQIAYPTDAQLDCAGLAAEASRMDALVAQANQQAASADGAARGAGLASTIAVEGLVRSGMLARVPGLGGFANQAAGLARQRAETVRANLAQTIQVATTRKALMSGLWSGKSCDATTAPAPGPAGPAGA